MLRLSSRGRYAVAALFDIAFHEEEERPAQLRDIASRQRIPARFLEQILLDLKRAGLVESKRGPLGGFRLTRSPAEIPLGEILRVVEGPLDIGGGAWKEGRAKRPRTGVLVSDVTDAVFADLARSVAKCFDAVTIADVCSRGVELGLRKQARGTASYVI